ncbi:MAG: fatty acid desaturase [Candidatus Thiodiazotropha taylori]|uniref:Fatty acid desaturase n=1 Tax=Candidatus Thiodiazotropha taylori TaxID=2792791 RepID=A0A9E4KC71_9GAMM|nr:fatty acid desaturase [Candidatus Thiodiazotropha taylori]MCW4256099.1 fatty acid desaturase [Candidatus Thiodiazotropha taylori]
MRQPRISWYRTPLSRQQLTPLMRKSDLKGGLFIFLHLTLLGITGASAYHFLSQGAWLMGLVSIALHGAAYAFLGWSGAGHELMHKTVFKSKRINSFFYKLFAFLSWNNPYYFSVSHAYHHKYTVHKELDQEVILPQKLSLVSWLWALTFNLPLCYRAIRITTENSLGIMRGSWSDRLFPNKHSKQRQNVIHWARFMLAGHLMLASLFIVSGHWPLLFIITLAPFILTWFNVVLAAGQHFGMQGDVSDFRQNSRTILLNPLLAFLYWQMNYHIEHHMYPNVPFHNLKQLHRLIAHDTPPPTLGLAGLIREMWTNSNTSVVDS